MRLPALAAAIFPASRVAPSRLGPSTLGPSPLALLVIAALALAGCGGDDTSTKDASGSDASASDGMANDGTGNDGTGNDGSASDASDDAGADVDQGNAPFTARASIGQVFVTHATKGEALELRDAAGKVVATGKADEQGSLIFRKVAPGVDYRVVASGSSPELTSGPLGVLSVDQSKPSQGFYAAQVIEPGFGYLTMRDGTKLAYWATLPGPAADGPYPTVVNYSGYTPAAPGTKIVSGEQEALCAALPVLCNAPDDPNALLAAVGGYATVSVNMRGTGCSGGAYDYFETLQLLDGYDVIEIVAAQPFVLHHKVGMVGLSYPGITQMFVAKMQPPSLAAIAPMSVIGDTVSTLVPGGILNLGFALSWIDRVLSKAAPYAQGWEQGRVDKGDTICAENQLLHSQRVDNVEQAKDRSNLNHGMMDPLNPTMFVGQIQVPVLLTSQWQDEQTGPYFFTLLDQFKASPSRRFLVTNGVHSDGFAPQVIAEWKAFLDLYVAKRKPDVGGYFPLLMPEYTKVIFGSSVSLPPDRWKGVKSYEDALKQWQSEPAVTVLMESGAGDAAHPGTPVATFSLTFPAWPPAGTTPLRYYLGADGALAKEKPAVGADGAQFRVDPDAGDRGIMGKPEPGKGIWSALPNYAWRADVEGDVASFVSAPLEQDQVFIGTGSVDLWIRVTETGVDDVDLEVTLTEVRPDGHEMLVQNGWLRASYRKLEANATELYPALTMMQADVQPLSTNTWTPVRITVAGFGHVFRKGSRIRLGIDTPGDTRADWRFELLPKPAGVQGDIHVQIAADAAHPSSLVLPLIAGALVPASATMPPCPSLRGQPCRVYVPTANVKVKAQ